MDYKLTVCDKCKTILVDPEKEYRFEAFEGNSPVPNATFYFCPKCYAEYLRVMEAQATGTKESMKKFLTAYKEHYGVGEFEGFGKGF